MFINLTSNKTKPGELFYRQKTITKKCLDFYF